MARTSRTRTAISRRALAAAAAAAAAAGLLTAGAGTALAAPAAHRAAATPAGCAAVPSSCGYPDATNTGVPAGTPLRQVPAQVTSGPGWTWNAAYGEVTVKGPGTVLTGLAISGSLDIQASRVTVNHVRVTGTGTSAVSFRHTAGVTIENSTISGRNLTAGRVNTAISDVYGDSTGMVITGNDISAFRIGIMMATGLVEGNYIHDPGYLPGDHTNGITAFGTAEPMTIKGNTVFNALGQTDAITLDATAPGTAVANKTVTGNFLAGGDYAIYAGAGNKARTSAIVITGNRFSQAYSPKCGTYGPVAYYDPAGPGSTWSGNTWDTTGQPVTP